MIKEALNTVADFILSANTYFGKAYSDVYITESGHVASEDKIIFPDDREGDYFYLRQDGDISFTNGTEFKVSDCSRGIGIRTTVNLVAIMGDADRYKLLSNLISTFQRFMSIPLQLNSAKLYNDQVIAEELKELSEEDLQAAFQKGFTKTIVSLNFSLLIPAIPVKDLSCIENPCKTC